MTVESREAWFAEFSPGRRPLWVYSASPASPTLAWLSLRSFYGRPAYEPTVEIGVYTAPAEQGRGHARQLLGHALAEAPSLGVEVILAFVFDHNHASVRLFETAGFVRWGLLPRVARLDGVARDLAILGRALPPAPGPR